MIHTCTRTLTLSCGSTHFPFSSARAWFCLFCLFCFFPFLVRLFDFSFGAARSLNHDALPAIRHCPICVVVVVLCSYACIVRRANGQAPALASGERYHIIQIRFPANQCNVEELSLIPHPSGKLWSWRGLLWHQRNPLSQAVP